MRDPGAKGASPEGRMANMGNQELSDTNVCQMNLSIETDAVSIKGYFNNLENLPRFAQYVPQDRNPESMGREWAENRKLVQFFQ